MRATLTFTSDTEQILTDTAFMLNKRMQTYNESDTHKAVLRITKTLEYAGVDQLPDILGDISALRTQLARLDFALEDTMQIVSGYYQAMTELPEVPEEPTTNDEV